MGAATADHEHDHGDFPEARDAGTVLWLHSAFSFDLELLKDLTQILQEIIGSGDEERFRRLEETIRAIDESRRKPGRTLH